jgi:hypothetical protein
MALVAANAMIDAQETADASKPEIFFKSPSLTNALLCLVRGVCCCRDHAATEQQRQAAAAP